MVQRIIVEHPNIAFGGSRPVGPKSSAAGLTTTNQMRIRIDNPEDGLVDARRRDSAYEIEQLVKLLVSNTTIPSPQSKQGGSRISPRAALKNLHRYHAGASRATGPWVWFHGLCNAFITVAERDIMLPRPLTKRLVNHAPDDDITEGYAADWDRRAAPRSCPARDRPHRALGNVKLTITDGGRPAGGPPV